MTIERFISKFKISPPQMKLVCHFLLLIENLILSHIKMVQEWNQVPEQSSDAFEKSSVKQQEGKIMK